MPLLESAPLPATELAGDPAGETAALVRRHGLTPPIAQLLWQRGWRDDQALADFLNPQLSHLHAPALLPDMDRALARIRAAIAAREPIVIFGDYDVDGVTAVVVLHAALRRLGAEVSYFIPDRFASGYGPTLEAVRQLASAGARLIITVDTGIRALAEVALATELGLDVIITDHHLPGPELPAACAVINPRRGDCDYPDKELSGAGLAFKLAQALLEEAGVIAGGGPGWPAGLARIAMLGIVADHVPLRGENRVLAHQGLAGLSETVNPGLRALLELALPGVARVRAGDVAFQLAPRLNSAGRLASATLAVELFTSPAPRAQAVARQLEQLNQQRRRLEMEILAAIQARRPAATAAPVALLWGEGWHRGVLGIVAARMLRQLQKPVLVAGCHEGMAHGSGRAPQGFALLEVLEGCGGLFSRFGGHAQAVGFTLPAARLPELEAYLAALPAVAGSAPASAPGHELDLPLQEISPALLSDLTRLEPCGAGNPEPWFRARARLAQPPQVLKERHLKLIFEPGCEALAWHAVQGPSVHLAAGALPLAALQPGCELDIIYRIEANTRARGGWQLILRGEN